MAVLPVATNLIRCYGQALPAAPPCDVHSVLSSLSLYFRMLLSPRVDLIPFYLLLVVLFYTSEMGIFRDLQSFQFYVFSQKYFNFRRKLFTCITPPPHTLFGIVHGCKLVKTISVSVCVPMTTLPVPMLAVLLQEHWGRFTIAV